ncbi:hypothetical protein E8E13_005200 [Curvularia kusanoi]|uniref:Uncharacterized protein n=1 Tax=Curvularia kusanoi TaxID=90978 RepID=A0A9P4TLH5_CURKU|nr:hypothetical protein E8E13_005200 [Curvularia kusanoi]
MRSVRPPKALSKLSKSTFDALANRPAINKEAKRIAAGLNEAKASVHDDTNVARNAEIAPDKRVTIKTNDDKAVQVMRNLSKGPTEEAVASGAKLRVKSPPMHKATLRWIQAHIWESVAIIVPLICTASTPGILWLVGFTTVGVRKLSVAAGIQAVIGKVAAGSAFAVFTSAAMGGYGAVIAFGSAWLIPTVFLGAVAAFKRWKSARRATKDNNDDSGKEKKEDRVNAH